jgi:uncharacterized protein (DUF58 family)
MSLPTWSRPSDLATLGIQSAPISKLEALSQARTRAALIPDMLVEAQRIAATVAVGWHGRRMRGSGENFWQFRPYVNGEPSGQIDWRRSARDDHSYVREKEWDAAHTYWLWADPSKSMQFRSTGVTISKESRALLIAFALADLLSRSGERIAWPGVATPFASRDGATKLGLRLASAKQTDALPDLTNIKRFSDVVIISDFAEESEDVLKMLEPLFARGIRGHMVEVIDPVEEDFPYAGRKDFYDPESGTRISAGRAQTVADEYRAEFLARRELLRNAAKQHGWSYTVSRTDKPVTATLLTLHSAFSAAGASGNEAML